MAIFKPAGMGHVESILPGGFAVTVSFMESAVATISHCRRHGMRIIATTPNCNEDLVDADFSGICAIAMGSEADGLSPEFLASVHARVRIKMVGTMDPLNVEGASPVVEEKSLVNPPAETIGKSERYGRAMDFLACFYSLAASEWVVMGVIIPYFIVGISDPPKKWDWSGLPDLGATTGKAICMGLHFLCGSVLTLLGTFQLWGGSRTTATRCTLHRICGRIYVGAAVLGFCGGAGFTLQQGALAGGIPMDISFVFYGMMVAGFALMAYKKAVDKDFEAHRRWAIRAFSMGMASFFYRVLGFIAVFTGLLPELTVELKTPDAERRVPYFFLFAAQIQTWAFWVIPLAFAEFYLRAPESKLTRAIMDVLLVGIGVLLFVALIGFFPMRWFVPSQ